MEILLESINFQRNIVIKSTFNVNLVFFHLKVSGNVRLPSKPLLIFRFKILMSRLFKVVCKVQNLAIFIYQLIKISSVR